MRLTDIAIKALKAPAKGQVTYFDDSLPGFGVRVSKSGAKSFVVVHGRNRTRTTLGRYPTVPLRKARIKARGIIAERSLGIREVPAIRFEEALELFLSSHYPENYPKPSTKKETTRLLKKHFLPPFRHEKLEDIQAHMISRVIDRLQSSPSMPRHAFAAIRQFFNWATQRGYIEQSPCARLRAPPPSAPRERVLNNKELKAVLALASSENTIFNNIILLLLYTGQRRGEIASLQADWINFADQTITIPGLITKNKRSHTFPFGKLSKAILKTALLRAESSSELGNEKANARKLLFPARGSNAPFNGWSKAKPIFAEKCGISPWVLHDLRRTFATNLAALGVPIHVTEKLLNHVSGTTGGIVSVYQRHTYLEEMRRAIEEWEQHLRSLTK